MSVKIATDYEDQLTTLMEDYVRATQLQISLRKRIEVLMKEREEAAKVQEEMIRLQWEDAKSKTQKLAEANELLKLKMRQTNSLESTSLAEVQTEVEKQDVKQGFSSSPMETRGRSRTPASLRAINVGTTAEIIYSESPLPIRNHTRSPSMRSAHKFRSPGRSPIHSSVPPATTFTPSILPTPISTHPEPAYAQPTSLGSWGYWEIPIEEPVPPPAEVSHYIQGKEYR